MKGRILSDEQRRRKNEMERERKKRKKEEINAKERERRKRKITSMSESEKKSHNKRAAKRKRLSRANKSAEEKEEERTANRIRFRKMWESQPLAEKREKRKVNSDRMRKYRQSQTSEERYEELAANSIRNTLAGKIRGPRIKMGIQKLSTNATAEEKMQIIANRNMLIAEHSLPTVQKRVGDALERVNLLRDARERAAVCIHDEAKSKKYTASISRDLRKAIDQHATACSIESERESMWDLSRDILKLTVIDPKLPRKTKEYLMAKRKLLQAGYDLAIAQKTQQKTQKIVHKEKLQYDSVNKPTRSGSQEYQDYLQRMVDRFGQSLQKAMEADKAAHFKVEELQKQHTSAEKVCDKALYGYVTLLKPDEETEKLIEEDHFSASGHTCLKCKERWFYRKRAVQYHEHLCGAYSNDGECDSIVATVIPNEQPLPEEEVAGQLINPSTGQYRSIADDVPDHINPENGYYKFGVRKCSKCHEFKHKNDFTNEEAGKRADKRACFSCM